jgi:arylsulfatase A-like enzyme
MENPLPTLWRVMLIAALGAAAVLLVTREEAPRAQAPADPSAAADSARSSWKCVGCNLLVISIDTMRADHLGCYGYDRPTSPNLDRLASRALLFKDVLAQSSTTAPSHRSLFSGRFVYQHRNTLKGIPVMAGLLSTAGYQTAAFVDGGQMRPQFGFSKGFASYVTTNGRHLAGAQVGGGLAVINPMVEEWIATRPDGRFFLFVHTYDVHCPYTPPEPYRSMFLSGLSPSFEVEDKCGAAYFNGLDLGPHDFEYIAALYDGGVRYTDAKVQEILETVRRNGLVEDTVIVITSDHGESLGERRAVGHNNIYDVQLKVPLIIALPSGRARVIETPVQSVDILPTLLSILGVESPAGLPGVDLTTRLDEAGEDDRVRLSQNASGTSTTVYEGKHWALMIKQGKIRALYDLRIDPQQLNDLQHERPDVAARLFRDFLERDVPEAELRSRPRDLDPKIVEELKALGYVED